MSENFFQKNQDIQFYVDKVIDWKSVIDLKENDYQSDDEDAPKDFDEALENTKAIMDYMGQICGDTVFPNAAEVDRQGVSFSLEEGVKIPEKQKENIEALSEAGLNGMSLDRQFGGLNCCHTAITIAGDMLGGADAGLSTILCLNWGVGNVLSHFADDATKEEWLPKLAAGECGAAMVLTEAGAGSDLGSLLTTATLDEAKNEWRINGTKRFITNGHAEAHLVLARSEPDSDGDVRGISLFLVEGKDAKVIRVEEKLGIHGSPTCEMVYENAPGILIGKRRYGLVRHMFKLMNEARLGTAAQGLGIAQIAFEDALRYADEREQFGTKIRQFPAVADMLVRMKTGIEGLRALVYKTAWYVDMYMSLEEKLENIKVALKSCDADKKEELKKQRDEVKRRAQTYHRYADTLTPLSKLKSGRLCVEVTDDAVQILGGSGYTKEFQVERYFRDARIVDVYEGTGQLQAKAAIGGVLNKTIEPLFDEITAATQDQVANDEMLKGAMDCLIGARADLNASIDYLISKQDSEDYETLKNLFEGKLCMMTAEIYSGYLLMAQTPLAERKKFVADRFIAKIAPRASMWRQEIMRGNVDTMKHFSALTESQFDD